MRATVPFTDVKHGGGAAMYRRAVLEQVGTFNPYVYSDEEPELCVRIRHKGYRIVQLGCPIVYHYSDPIEAMSTLIGRWKRRLYLGAGQNLRYHYGKDVFWPYFKERGFGILPAVGLIAGAAALVVSAVAHQWLWFGLWLAALIAVIALDTYRKRSPYRALYSLLLRLLIMDGTIRGFLMEPMTPDDYPVKLEIVRRAG